MVFDFSLKSTASSFVIYLAH